MKGIINFHFQILLSAVWIAVLALPYDDGKYNPKKYRVYDDGKYYRPLDEGKYIPGDEGRYTYVYRQGLYPTDDGDYRYIHQEGPNGGFGGNGGGGDGGGSGADGQNSADGNSPHKIEYIGRRIYAERYPYIHKVIKSLVDEYVSSDILASEGSESHYRKVYADNEVAAKCRYLTPSDDKEEFVTQYVIKFSCRVYYKLFLINIFVPGFNLLS